MNFQKQTEKVSDFSRLSPTRNLNQCNDFAFYLFCCMFYRFVRLSLLNVRIHSLQHGFLDQKTHQALNSILVIFLDKWRIYQEQERQREEEEGRLFKYKDRSHGSNMSEEEENELAVRRAFPSFDSEFKDVMVQDDLNESGEQLQLENTPPESLLASNAELFMTAMKDYSEIRSIHEEMFCRLLSSQDLSFGVKDSGLSSSVDSLYRQAFECGYQTAGMVKAMAPCKFFISVLISISNRSVYLSAQSGCPTTNKRFIFKRNHGVASVAGILKVRHGNLVSSELRVKLPPLDYKTDVSATG